MMKIKAQAKWLKIPPRKLGRVAEIIRGLSAIEAMNLLYPSMYLQALQGTVQQKFMIMLQDQQAELGDNTFDALAPY